MMSHQNISPKSKFFLFIFLFLSLFASANDTIPQRPNIIYILADDMGLGKTTSTIIAALETRAKKILIICPATLKINWNGCPKHE